MMRKVISLLLALLMLPLAGCGQEEPVQTKPPTEPTPVTEAATEPPTEETEPMDEYEIGVYNYYSQFVKIDDTTPLEEALTVSYPLEELTAYFYPANWDERWQYFAELPWVHDAFPIEIMRSNYYTVYRVEEGGYFYVFWDGHEDGYPYVSFSSYLPGDRTLEDFAEVEIGVTTFREMHQLDPGIWFWGNANYLTLTYLNAEELLWVDYIPVEIFDEEGEFYYYEYVVDSMEVVTRGEYDRKFDLILPQDLP